MVAIHVRDMIQPGRTRPWDCFRPCLGLFVWPILFQVWNYSLTLGNYSLILRNYSLTLGNYSLILGNYSLILGNDSLRLFTIPLLILGNYS